MAYLLVSEPERRTMSTGAQWGARVSEGSAWVLRPRSVEILDQHNLILLLVINKVVGDIADHHDA